LPNLGGCFANDKMTKDASGKKKTKPKSAAPKKKINKTAEKVEVTLEGIRIMPVISGTTSTNIDFTNGGLVEKFVVAKGASVTMKF